MTESGFRGKMIVLLARHGVWLEPVENLIGVGFPDCIAWVPGGGIPVELKYLEAPPARATTQLLGSKGLRPDQIAWWRKADRHGTQGWVMAGVGKEVFAAPGALYERLNAMSWEEWQRHRVDDMGVFAAALYRGQK